MKTYYDRNSQTPTYDIGEQVWVFTLKTKKGLSKKLMHHWDGPYRIVKKLSPSHYIVKVCSGHKVSSTVHFNRMKPYCAPDERPTAPPEGELDASLLEDEDVIQEVNSDELDQNEVNEIVLENPPPAEEEVCSGSGFHSCQNENIQQRKTVQKDEETSSEIPENDEENEVLDEDDVFIVEKILNKRTKGNKVYYRIKWKDYPSSENSWEPIENISPALVQDYEARRKPKANNSTKKRSANTSVFAFSLSRGLWFSLFAILSLFTVVASEQVAFDAIGQRVTYFPEAMVLTHTPKTLTFFEDTKLLFVNADLNSNLGEMQTKLETNCSGSQGDFFETVLDSMRILQIATRKLLKISDLTNLIECSVSLKQWYHASTAKVPQFLCRPFFKNSLSLCRKHAFQHCTTLNADEKAWLTKPTSRFRRTSWLCHAGGFGFLRAIWTSTGHSCESNRVSKIKQAFKTVSKAVKTSRKLIHNVNGKVVYLVKATDKLHSQVNAITSSMQTLEDTLHTWKDQLNSFSRIETCQYNTNVEFLAKFSDNINVVFTTMLRLFEITNIVQQVIRIKDQTLIGFQHLPNFLTAKISKDLAQIDDLSHTLLALKNGYPLILHPNVDFEYSKTNELQMNLLFTIPEIKDEQYCTVEYLKPIIFKINSSCYSGPIRNSDYALITCLSERYITKVESLHSCYIRSDHLLCPKTVLKTSNATSWLGISWRFNSNIQLARRHQKVRCPKNNPRLIHVGSRHYLALEEGPLRLTNQKTGTTQIVKLSPLIVYEIPCNLSFYEQQIGPGPCTDVMYMNIPVFKKHQFQYFPWKPGTDKHVLNLHLDSLNIPPPLKLDNKTLTELNEVYNELDAQLYSQLETLDQQIRNIKESSSTTWDEILLYLAIVLASISLILAAISLAMIRKFFKHKPQIQIVHAKHSCRKCSNQEKS